VTLFYRRRDPGVGDGLGALAVAVCVGAVSFYVVRMLLLREGIERDAPRRLSPARTEVAPAPDSGA